MKKVTLTGFGAAMVFGVVLIVAAGEPGGVKGQRGAGDAAN
jgi:hypothetical protein